MPLAWHNAGYKVWNGTQEKVVLQAPATSLFIRLLLVRCRPESTACYTWECGVTKTLSIRITLDSIYVLYNVWKWWCIITDNIVKHNENSTNRHRLRRLWSSNYRRTFIWSQHVSVLPSFINTPSQRGRRETPDWTSMAFWAPSPAPAPRRTW